VKAKAAGPAGTVTITRVPAPFDQEVHLELLPTAKPWCRDQVHGDFLGSLQFIARSAARLIVVEGDEGDKSEAGKREYHEPGASRRFGFRLSFVESLLSFHRDLASQIVHLQLDARLVVLVFVYAIAA
jgi:hypothetical protein